mmetsp:Transcript_6481/g.13006  ORF Transcript_6481/g.13006 Transcript_6481/m.13006 type:complete len:353 (-) Transcript_6481:418-1476(-)
MSSPTMTLMLFFLLLKGKTLPPPSSPNLAPSLHKRYSPSSAFHPSSLSMRSIAPSVLFPITCSESSTSLAELLREMPLATIAFTLAEALPTSTPPKIPSTTFILFSVSVPVLSEQILVAFPIVSHAARCLIKLLSLSIFLVLKARLMVTARGRPSGTATTTMVTAIMKASRTAANQPSSWEGSSSLFIQRIPIRARKVAPAAAIPMYPIIAAISSSFSCKGVWVCSVSSLALILPHCEFLPVAMTSMHPLPSTTLHPESAKGSTLDERSWRTCFSTPSGSPVRLLSSTVTPPASLETRIPSAGILSPGSSIIMSPTTTSFEDISTVRPSLNALTSLAEMLTSSSFLNCCSFW